MYKSIEEYVEINYGDDLKKGLICFLAGDDFIDVRDFSVYKINYKTSERDHVVCEVIVRIKYSFVESASRSKVAYYSATMEGSFRKGFKPVSKEFEKLENGKEERYTSSLVPVMAKEEYDAYATKFLKYFCPSALKKPTKLKLDTMLKNKEMVFHPAPLGSEILGKIYFAKDKATIYANLQDLSEVKIVDVGPGTILINYDKITEYGDGAMRNTVIHEAVHYFFHSNYFERRFLLDSKNTSAVCYRGYEDYEDEDVYWMEKQARALAPRILMPRDSATAKINELLESTTYFYKGNEIDRWKYVVEELASFFGVSKQSAKYRICELGFKQADGIDNYIDGKYIKDYSFVEGALKDHQTFILSKNALVSLMENNKDIRQAFINGSLVFVNNMVVSNNHKYVNLSKGTLTDYALKHVDECALIFDIREAKVGEGKKGEFSYQLFSSNSKLNKVADVNPAQLAKIVMKADENAKHFELHKSKLPTGLGDTIRYHMEKCNYTYEALAIECDISEKTIRNYVNERSEPSQLNIIKISLAMRLSYPYINDLLFKADKMILNPKGANSVLVSILSSFSRVGLLELYAILDINNLGELLKLSSNFLEENKEVINDYKNKIIELTNKY